MSIYKIVGAHPPSSKNDKEVCPWCPIKAVEIADLSSDISWLTIGSHKENSMLPELHLSQIVPDPLHGVRRIIVACLLDVSKKLLTEAKYKVSVVESMVSTCINSLGKENLDEID